MLLMMDQHPQRGWQSRTRVLCAPRSGRRSLTATAAEGTRASAPSLLAATACREGRPFIMRGQDTALVRKLEQLSGWENGRDKKRTCLNAGPEIHSLSHGSFWLSRRLQLWFCGFPRLLLRSELLLNLEGYSVRIDSVGLSSTSTISPPCNTCVFSARMTRRSSFGGNRCL